MTGSLTGPRDVMRIPQGKQLLTGVAVVSSQPQSTTRPVIRPHAAKASTELGVNDTEGT